MANTPIGSFTVAGSVTTSTHIILADGDGTQYPLDAAVDFALENLSTGSSISGTDSIVAIVGGVAEKISLNDVFAGTLPDVTTLSVLGVSATGTSSPGTAQALALDGSLYLSAGTLAVSRPLNAELLWTSGGVFKQYTLGTGLSVSSSGTGTSTSFTLNSTGGTGGGGTPWNITDGTNTVDSVTELLIDGATISTSGTSGSATLTVSGGGGGSLEIVCGTTTLTGISELILEGGTLTGTGSTATYTPPSGGSSGDTGHAPYSRPALSSFTVSNSTTLCTATDITNGPILVQFAPGGTYQSIVNWNKTVSGPEWMLTVCLSQGQFKGYHENIYTTLGFGVKATDGQLFVVRALSVQAELDFITMTNETSYNTDLYSYVDTEFTNVWYRLWATTVGSDLVYYVYRSVDGYAWGYVGPWNGISGVSGTFTPASVLFYIDCGGDSFGYNIGSLHHWDVQTGTGASLNPYAPVSS